MPSSNKQLRSYQDEDIWRVIGLITTEQPGSNDILLYWGTGLGKTLAALVIISVLLKSEQSLFTHVIIATPQTNIGTQFVRKSASTYTRVGSTIEQDLLPVTLKEGGVNLDGYCRLPSGGPIVVTHKLFSMQLGREALRREFSSDSEKRLLLIFDEAHHASDSLSRESTEAGALVHELIDTGHTTCIRLTATPYRTDGLPVYQGEHRIERPLSAMMLSGFLTESLHTLVVPSKYINLEGVTRKKDLNEGVVNVENIGLLAEQVVGIWVAEGRPPALVRFRASSELVNNELNKELVRAFDAAGGRVVKAFGSGGANELNEAIEMEDDSTLTSSYEDIKSVIIACQRASEGMDSPYRCLGISIGLPQSESLRVQLVGRIMRLRLKIALTAEGERDNGVEPIPLLPGYPVDWLTKSKQIFIVGDHSLESNKETRDILLMLAIFDGHSLAAVIRKLFKMAGKLDLLTCRLSKKIAKACDGGGIEEAIVTINDAMNWWVANRSPDDSPLNSRVPTLQLTRIYENRYLKLIDPIYTSIPEDTLNCAFSIWYQAQVGDDPRVADLITRGFENDLFDDPGFQAELDALCDSFKLEAKEGHLHELFGGDISVWGSRMANIIEKRMGVDVSVRTLSDVDAHVQGYIDRNRELPGIMDKVTSGSKTCFRTHDNCLKRGDLGKTYPGGLAQYWVEHCGLATTWRNRTSELAEVYRNLKIAGETGLWESREKTCPIKMYLGEWVKYAVSWPLPENLDLATACTTSPRRFNSVDLARRAEQVRMESPNAQ